MTKHKKRKYNHQIKYKLKKMKKNNSKVIASENISVFDIADFFIRIASQKMIDDNLSEGITHLKLQKILYFAQAVYLSIYNKALFNEEIQSWQYGPVIKEVYSKYSRKGNSTITTSNFEYKIDDKKIAEFLKSVWELFGKYSAYELINITHNHAPWKESYVKGCKDIIIEKKVLRDYYKGLFDFKSKFNG
ncbi:MAG: DUF4065 domain-containing protein [Arcobacter sp.]|uniref:Panacea domain-containing protein n=1 Tax=Arcobacter sp. TaxID=1872629 RepID=UPI002A76052E|nr:type II toxin-antitoxin system antitoxin SocA domain-containing protein [Arcobacter sp.]MDY3205918.1 DUF4065 domain-containing protein [Arcobacter sp.]